MTDASGEVLERNDYSGFGKRLAISTGSSNRYRFIGKEEQRMSFAGWLDFGARMYDPETARWTTPDPLASQYPGISPYAYCANDPVNFVDPEGMDWYSYMRESRDKNKQQTFVTEYAWTDASSQEELDNLGIKGTYLGEVVVVFDGYYDERAGENISITGEGAKAATVTVYGRNGAEDKQNYVGYTMTSNYNAFGAIDNGVYDVTYKVPGKGGVLASNYAVNDAGPVDCLNGINPSPLNFNPYSSTQKNGIYIHRTNIAGRIPYDLAKGKAVSSGCLLVNDSDWLDFVNQIGKNGFKLILNRK